MNIHNQKTKMIGEYAINDNPSKHNEVKKTDNEVVGWFGK